MKCFHCKRTIAKNQGHTYVGYWAATARLKRRWCMRNDCQAAIDAEVPKDDERNPWFAMARALERGTDEQP
jgi:hypothetical protein